jgi:ABC-type uncharacterized transport system permease subunit
MSIDDTIRHALLASIAAIALAAVPLSAAGAAIKCWTNHEGVRECGNAVPPEFAQQGHETLNKQGLTTNTAQAAKTREELLAERATADAARKAELEVRQREQADRVLLDTFASVDDLELTRDGQVAHLESQIRLVQSHLEKLQVNLDQMIERAAEVERRGEMPSAEMIENVESMGDQIRENEEFIANKEREQEEIRARFEADISRFRVLMGLQ